MITMIAIKTFIITTLIAVFIFLFTKLTERRYTWGSFAINIAAMFFIFGIYLYKSHFVSSVYISEALNTFCLGGLLISALVLFYGVCCLVTE